MQDAFVELIDSSISIYHDASSIEYAVEYTANRYVEERIDEAINVTGF